MLLLQLLISTHPSRITRLYEMPEFFSSVTNNSVLDQLSPGRTLQQEIDVRIGLMHGRTQGAGARGLPPMAA